MLPKWLPFCASRGIFGCHDWGGVIHIKWVEARDATNVPTNDRTAPHNKKYWTRMAMVQKLNLAFITHTHTHFTGHDLRGQLYWISIFWLLVLTCCLNNTVGIYSHVWTFSVVGAYAKTYTWARRDECFREEVWMCIPAYLKNHNNPQNTNNENRSFYKVNFNGHGGFVG